MISEFNPFFSDPVPSPTHGQSYQVGVSAFSTKGCWKKSPFSNFVFMAFPQKGIIFPGIFTQAYGSYNYFLEFS